VYNFGQRTVVCSEVDEGVKQDVGNRNKAIDNLSFTDR